MVAETQPFSKMSTLSKQFAREAAEREAKEAAAKKTKQTSKK